MDLFKLVQQTRGAHTLRLCLVGDTGSGKSSRVREWGEKLGMPVHVQLLGTMMPEESLGLPKVEKNFTRWTLTESIHEACERPVILFMDELDKAREETRATALTLSWDHEAHNRKLHPESIIIYAMNKVPPEQWLSSETGKAMSARLLFAPIKQDWGWLSAKTSLDFSWMPQGSAPILPVLQEPSMRQIEVLVRIVKNMKLGTYPEIFELAEMTLPKSIAESFAKTMVESNTMSVEQILSDDLAGLEYAKRSTLPELVECAAHVDSMTLDVWSAIATRIMLEADLEMRESFFAKQHARFEENGNFLLVPDSEVKTFEERFLNLTQILFDRWALRRSESGEPVDTTKSDVEFGQKCINQLLEAHE